MTDAEKKLLLEDLCARLPYGVKVSIIAHNIDYEEDFGKTIIAELTGIQTAKDDDDITYPCFVTCYDKYKTQGNDIETIKPYLRPMSSMTEREKEEFQYIAWGKILETTIVRLEFGLSFKTVADIEDWLNAHHFDYRGLIPMGLALEAPEVLYITE